MPALKRMTFGRSQSGLHRAAAGSDAPSLLFVHPANLQARSWDRVLAELPGGWGLAAIDLSGHGESPRAPDYLVDGWVQECDELLDRLEWHDVHLVGASVGAAVAVALASESPGRVRSVTTIGGAFRAVPVREADEFVQLLREQGAAPMLAKAISEDAGMTDVEAADAIADISANPDETVARIWIAAAAAAGLDDAYQLQSPTLAIVGDQDLNCPVEDSAAFVEATDGRLAVLAGHGHLPMYTAADQVARLISTQVETRADSVHDLALAPLKGTP